MTRSFACFAALLVVVGSNACSSSGGEGESVSSFPPAQPVPDADGGGPQALDIGDAAAGVPGASKIVFYANSDTTLFQLDPENLTAPMKTIGTFDCVGVPGGTTVMTDIAVSKTGKVYGVSAAAAWPITITGSTVHCDAKWPLAYDTHFNGLTFAPENTVAVDEVLIGGNEAGELYRIDTGTGASTQVGTLGIDPVTGLPWSVSGDVVFMANSGNPIGFATVRTCPTSSTCSYTDSLMEIDVKALHPGKQSVMKSIRGLVNRGSWCTNPASPASFGSMFGAIAFHEKVYGFSRKGDFIEILNDTGSGCLVASNPSVKFAGAGITTIAPVAPPPPR